MNDFFSKIIFKIFFVFFSKINRICTEFFFKYKKIAKIIIKIFFEKIFLSNFFWRKFVFSQNYFCEIFFTIFSRIDFVFDVCEIMYFAKFFIRNFAYCEFFCFAFLVYGKKNCKFLLRFFFQWWTSMPNLKMFLFWKKVKFSLMLLLDFFTRTIITMLRDEQRTRKIQNNMKRTTGYLE